MVQQFYMRQLMSFLKSAILKNYKEICQKEIKIAAWMEPKFSRLPGLNPLGIDDWLFSDDVFSEQMAYRDYLISNKKDVVFQCLPGSEAACEELLADIVTHLHAKGYVKTRSGLIRPDGIEINLLNDHPLLTAGRLTQHDLCVMELQGDEHVLTAACLCFPSSWSLTEKIGRPLIKIHEPVPNYTADLARRVQRVFDVIRVGHPMFRVNTLIYSDPNLHQPRTMSTRRSISKSNKLWVRSEFQSLVRLQATKVVIFGIHNTIVPLESLTKIQKKQLELENLMQAYGVERS